MTTRYGKETTTDELLEGRTLSGRRMLITGGTSGLGLETARVLAAHGAHVVITARDADKAERAVATIRAAAAPGATVEVRELDLASLASVHACADRLLAEGQPIHVLFANAGVMACPQGRTREGFETQIGTNHLGHFVFVGKLAPLVTRERTGAHRRHLLRRAPHLGRRSRRPELRAHALRPVAGLRPLEDGQRVVRGRARPATEVPWRAGLRAAPGRHPDGARPAHDAGVDRSVDEDHRGARRRRPVSLQDDPAGRGDTGVGRHRRGRR